MLENGLDPLIKAADCFLNTVTRIETAALTGLNTTPAGLKVLNYLIANGPDTVPHIASRLGTSRQNIQRLVNELKRQSLVTYDPNDRHKTSPNITPTPEAQRICEQLFQKRNLALSSAFGEPSSPDVAATTAFLEKLSDIVTPPHRRQEASRASTPPKSPQAPKELQPTSISQEEESELPINLL